MNKSSYVFKLKTFFKSLLQNLILPLSYNFWQRVYGNKKHDLIIFADAHHKSLPFSMEYIHHALEEKGYEIVDEIYDYSSMSQLKSAWISIRFMKLYARAKLVFICDNFLPVSSCKKNPKTTVIQLWHCCGLMKKMGYDTEEDIPHNYKGNVYRNYDLVTVSSPFCESAIANAMHLMSNEVQGVGVSRTDNYFDEAWIQRCKEEFFVKYSEAKDKKIIVWAPTFRGNAGNPYLIGMDEIRQLEQQMGDGYYFIYKVHPHLEKQYHLSDCDIPTERLLPVTDLLISDYSTVIYDFLFFEKPYVLFAPDLDEYQNKRGFYVEYDQISPYIVTDASRLKDVVTAAIGEENHLWIQEQKKFHISACDGKSTERIIKRLNL